ncbi:MAG: hypothetical protein PVF97_02745, partial [Desulfobacterales bacterium]
MKTKAFRLAAVVLVLWIFPSLVVATPPAIQSIDHQAAGEYRLQIRSAGDWQQVATLYFDHRFATRTVDLSKFLRPGAPAVIRLVQKGGGAAHIDAILLGDEAPQKIDGVDQTSVVKKMAVADFDVIDAHDKTYEIVFPARRNHSTLSLTARVEPEAISKVPFQFPSKNLFKPIDAKARFYTYKLDLGQADARPGKSPQPPVNHLFKEHCRTGSGHPSGYTYGWVWNDAEKLYVKLDFTPDNTQDGNKDYAIVHVNTGSAIKRFEIRESDQKWGRPLFAYSDKVEYQHKLYQFEIPLAELGLSREEKPASLMLAFSAYGTAAPGPPLPGVDILYGGSGVQTRTFNSTSPTTYLNHDVQITDYDGIAADGSSHTVTVTYPDLTVRSLVFSHSTGPYSAVYQLWDDTIPQPFDSLAYSGDYTYRVDDSWDATQAVETFSANPVDV